jgi:GH24 family phage-related lysozyme (muramidase)
MFEGFSSKPYICSAGYLTISFGYVILPHESFSAIDEAEAEEIPKKDLQKAKRGVKRLVQVLLSQGQFNSLVIAVFILNLRLPFLERSYFAASFYIF